MVVLDAESRALSNDVICEGGGSSEKMFDVRAIVNVRQITLVAKTIKRRRERFRRARIKNQRQQACPHGGSCVKSYKN